MNKLLLTLTATFILTGSHVQAQTKVSTFLMAEYNNTLYDRTKANNPWGVGLGVQTFIRNNSKFTPVIELTRSFYLEDDKVFRSNTDGTEIDDVRAMTNLFAGASFSPAKSIYFSFMAGPSFIHGQTLLGIKPSFGFYFSPSQRWTGKISYINIFNRDKATNQDFGSLSVGIGLRLF